MYWATTDGMVVLAFNGTRLWHVETSNPRANQPTLLEGDIVILVNSSSVLAFNTVTGRSLWSRNTARGTQASPTIVAVLPNSTLVVSSCEPGGDGNDSFIDLIDAASGNVVLSYDAPFAYFGACASLALPSSKSPSGYQLVSHLQTSPSQLVSADLANPNTILWAFGSYGTFYGNVQALTPDIVIVESTEPNVIFYAVDASTGKSLWNYTGASNVISGVPMSRVSANDFYISLGPGQMTVIDVHSGRERISQFINCQNCVASGQPAVADSTGQIFVSEGFNSCVHSYEMQKTQLSQKWQSCVTHPTDWYPGLGTPAVGFDGSLYVVDYSAQGGQSRLIKFS